jgi:hypothetical protein
VDIFLRFTYHNRVPAMTVMLLSQCHIPLTYLPKCKRRFGLYKIVITYIYWKLRDCVYVWLGGTLIKNEILIKIEGTKSSFAFLIGPSGPFPIRKLNLIDS